MTTLGTFPAYSAQTMASLRLDGFNEEEKRRLVEDVFEDNIDFLSEQLDADQYVNALRQRRSLRPDHADEIFQATTSTKKNNVLLSALRKSEDPLKALTNLIDVITDKGFQPHVAKRLSQSFTLKKKAFRESRGLPGNRAALTQPLSSALDRDTPPTFHGVSRPPSHTAAQPPTTALPLSRERSGSGSTVSAVESVGFSEEAQRLVVSRAPDLNSKRNSGPYPPPSIHSVPPTSLRSHPPPSVHSQPPPSIHSPPPPSLPPPSTHSYSSGWSADLESEIGSGPFPPNPGPLYEDRSDGFGPRPHSPAPLPDIGESNDRYGNVDPEFGAMPPPPPPLANPDVDHEDSHYSPVVPPSWDTQVLNNSLPMSVQSLKTSPGPTLILPPQGHPLDHTSGSSSTSSLSFAAIQGHASELERTADALGAENLQLRRENTQLQRENTQLQQRVAWLEAELHRYCAVASFTPDMPNNQ